MQGEQVFVCDTGHHCIKVMARLTTLHHVFWLSMFFCLLPPLWLSIGLLSQVFTLGGDFVRKWGNRSEAEGKHHAHYPIHPPVRLPAPPFAHPPARLPARLPLPTHLFA